MKYQITLKNGVEYIAFYNQGIFIYSDENGESREVDEGYIVSKVLLSTQNITEKET
jgi:hypothetical protein